MGASHAGGARTVGKAIVGALVFASWSALAMASSDAARTAEPMRLGSGARVVVVAPHPDDETIAAAGGGRGDGARGLRDQRRRLPRCRPGEAPRSRALGGRLPGVRRPAPARGAGGRASPRAAARGGTLPGLPRRRPRCALAVALG